MITERFNDKRLPQIRLGEAFKLIITARMDYELAISHLSVSIAAAQPEPAAVIA